MSEAIDVRLSPDELREVIGCGAALAQNVPEKLSANLLPFQQGADHRVFRANARSAR